MSVLRNRHSAPAINPIPSARPKRRRTQSSRAHSPQFSLQPLEPRRLLSAPIIITAGGTYTGTWQSTSINQPAVLIDTTAPVTLLNSTISGPGNLIATGINGVNLTVQNCTATALNPNVAGVAPGEFLDSINAASLTIENNTITNAGGYALNVDGFIGTGSDTITILNNSFSNINGMYSNGSGGYESSGQTSPHAIILNTVVGVANINIGWNQIINTPGESFINDVINIYDSSGTSASPINIHDNYIQGLYAINPQTQSDSGSGIITDGGLTNETAYVNITNNILISTGNAGINIAAGHNINVTGNTCISSGYLPNGEPIFADNVGICIWDEMSGGSSATFYSDGASGNTVGWVQAPGITQNTTSSARTNDYWMPSETSSMTYSNTSVTGSITAATQTAELTAWQAKLTAANQIVGVPSAPATSTSTSTSTPTTSGTGASVIVTTSETSDITLTGKWWSGTFLSGYYGSSFLNDGNQLKGQKSVTFNATLPAAGSYQVYIWDPSASSLATNVPVTIATTAGNTTVTINEQIDGGEWVLLGTFNLNANAQVTVSNTGTNGEVAVNAVKFVQNT